ncbi:hypothetical protein [Marinomonas sp. IMCC 4694]|uniref:hypothetical protein n=1 Tax=Marinomonas sp. IMCC 4694 TaxID=2605432 RepID=UPI0011E66920|nr:hypothetical protein [Marinomonas sp. IMCC 4694]TYL47151.1 hypothetical protein FXV75_03860 [Marinomonas sp. IMCC 4694]
MFDVSYLAELSRALEQSVIDQDIEKIQQLCDRNHDFILSIEPQPDPIDNEKIRHFINTHKVANQLVSTVHAEMQKQLYQVKKNRQGVNQYKGVKNAK